MALQQLSTHWPHKGPTEPDAMQHVLAGRHVLPPVANSPRFLLIYASRRGSQDCNACAPELSFFEFTRGGDGQAPTLGMASVAAMALGYAGDAPQTHIQPLGEARYAVLLSWEEYAQGSATLLSVVLPREGQMREVLREAMDVEYEQTIAPGVVINVAWRTEYRFQPGARGTLDLHLHRHVIEGASFLLDPTQNPWGWPLTTEGRVRTSMVFGLDAK